MSDYKYTNLKLVARHVPDYSMEKDSNGNAQKVELPGHVEIGTEIEGVFVPLEKRKAAGLFADIERVKSDKGKGGGS